MRVSLWSEGCSEHLTECSMLLVTCVCTLCVCVVHTVCTMAERYDVPRNRRSRRYPSHANSPRICSPVASVSKPTVFLRKSDHFVPVNVIELGSEYMASSGIDSTHECLLAFCAPILNCLQANAQYRLTKSPNRYHWPKI